ILITELGLARLPAPPGGDVVGAILTHAYQDSVLLAPVASPAVSARLLSLLARGHSYATAANDLRLLLEERLRQWSAAGNPLAAWLLVTPNGAGWLLAHSL